MWLLQHHALHSAPIAHDDPDEYVLDIGCGAGTWAIDYATEHPNARVLAVDISCPKHRDSERSNCHFRTGNVEKEWKHFVRGNFDFIHIRMMVNSIRDWPLLLNRCIQHLNPGGWLEINDVANRFFSADGCSETESPMLRWWRIVFQGCAEICDIDIHATYMHAQEMWEAGFVDVRERVFTWPVGSARAKSEEEKKIGKLQIKYLKMLVHKMTESAAGSVRLAIPDTEIYAMGEQAERDLVENADAHGYYMHYATIVGRRRNLEEKPKKATNRRDLLSQSHDLWVRDVMNSGAVPGVKEDTSKSQ
ncbi:hypothetical protein ACLMJK_003788 [Lecanora helva]